MNFSVSSRVFHVLCSSGNWRDKTRKNIYKIIKSTKIIKRITKADDDASRGGFQSAFVMESFVLLCCHKRFLHRALMLLFWLQISINMKGFYRDENRQMMKSFSHISILLFSSQFSFLKWKKVEIAMQNIKSHFHSGFPHFPFLNRCTIRIKLSLLSTFDRVKVDLNRLISSFSISFYLRCENNFPMHFAFSSFIVSFAERMTLFDFPASTWMSMREIVVLH